MEPSSSSNPLPFLRYDDPNKVFNRANRHALGSGCFATVYRAECVEARAPEGGFPGLVPAELYAVKVLHKDTSPASEPCVNTNATTTNSARATPLPAASGGVPPGKAISPSANHPHHSGYPPPTSGGTNASTAVHNKASVVIGVGPIGPPVEKGGLPPLAPPPQQQQHQPHHHHQAVAGKEATKEDPAVAQKWRNVVHEIAILKRLNSPFCVRLHDSFQDEKAVYLVLEYVRAVPLVRVIQNRAGWSERRVALITEQLVRALVYLHSQCIVHRDLKPDNILVDEATLHIKLIDFGFAKFFGRHLKDCPYAPTPPAHPGSIKTQIKEALALGTLSTPDSASELISSTPLGATKFLAPEVLIASQVKPRMTTRMDIQKLDIFAVGVIVYLMLGAEYPFKAASRKALELTIRKGVCFTSPRFEEVSEEARDFCRWLLHHDRQSRPFARDCLAHPWLGGQAPDVPYPHSQEDVPECNLTDNGLFAELRKAETVLDKQHDEASAQDHEALQNAIDQRKGSRAIVLELPARAKNAASPTQAQPSSPRNPLD